MYCDSQSEGLCSSTRTTHWKRKVFLLVAQRTQEGLVIRGRIGSHASNELFLVFLAFVAERPVAFAAFCKPSIAGLATEHTALR